MADSRIDYEREYIRAEVENSVFYKECQLALKGNLLKLLGVNLAAVFAFGMLVLLPVYISCSKLVMLLSILLFIAADICVLILFQSRKKKSAGLLYDKLYSLTADEIRELSRQARVSGMKYDTLFLLDKYIFIPQEMLMLPYESGENVFSVFIVRRIPVYCCSNAELRITLKEKTIRLEINRPNDYFVDYESFLEFLNSKNE